MSELVFWASSADSESWTGPDTIEEAIKEATGQYDRIFVSRDFERLDPAYLIDAVEFFDQFDESFENCPAEETWQMYWGSPSSAMQELTDAWVAAFREWEKKMNLREWYTVKSEHIEEIPIPSNPVKEKEVGE